MDISSLITLKPGDEWIYGFYCVSEPRQTGFKEKSSWYKANYEYGLRNIVAFDEKKRQLGFIEFMPGKHCWKPVDAPDHIFINCIWIKKSSDRFQRLGSILLKAVEQEVEKLELKGLVVLSSEGSWNCGPEIFEQNDYTALDEWNDYTLFEKGLKEGRKTPTFIRTIIEDDGFEGLTFRYSDQCPFMKTLIPRYAKVAAETNIPFRVFHIENAAEARNCPSPFGTFCLTYRNKVIATHPVNVYEVRKRLIEEYWKEKYISLKKS